MRIALIAMLGVVATNALPACGGGSGQAAGIDPQPAITSVQPAGMKTGATAGSAAPAPMQPTNPTPAQPSTASMQPAPGGQAMQPPSDPAMTPAQPSGPQQPSTPKLALDECKQLQTKWAGDEYCILPPPDGKGFQVRIGPSDYDNPETQYVIEPGQETTESFPAVSGNDKDIFFYFRQYRMRPGSHHLIISKTASGFDMGSRLGGSQNLAADNPVGGVIPPENADVGVALAAKTSLSVQLHYINTTDGPLIKEAWVNFWYQDPAAVKEPAYELYLSGGGINVAPNTHVVLNYKVPVMGDGRILRLYGHGHAHNVRFSAWRVRAAQRDLIYEDFDWLDPAVFEYNSLTQNPKSNAMQRIAGAFSGQLDIKSGDQLEFECEIDDTAGNTQSSPSSAPLTFANESQTGEMCILIGDSVGVNASVPPLSFNPTISQL